MLPVGSGANSPAQTGAIEKARFDAQIAEAPQILRAQDGGSTGGPSWLESLGDRFKKLFQRMTGTEPNDHIARTLFDEALELYRSGQFEDAARRFERAASRAADRILREEALFWAGESWFYADFYPRATRCYQKLLKEFEYTRYLDPVVYREFLIGRYWEQIGLKRPRFLSLQFTDPTRPRFDTLGHALKLYQTIRTHDPTGPLADDALMASANLHFVRKRFADAAAEYDLLRKEYPNSEHLLDAHLLGLHSKLWIYQGPLYDGTPLLESRELTLQTLQLFGEKLGEERQRLLRLEREIEEAIADRDLALGKFYERKRKYAAARFYYESVIAEHPMTEAAEKAKIRLDAIREMPDNPPNYFAWLTTIFPEKR